VGVGERCLGAEGRAFIPTLRRDVDEDRQILDSAGALYARGVALDGARLAGDGARGFVALPTYPFQRDRHWTELGARRPPRPDVLFTVDWRVAAPAAGPAGSWLIVTTETAAGERLARALADRGASAFLARPEGIAEALARGRRPGGIVDLAS